MTLVKIIKMVKMFRNQITYATHHCFLSLMETSYLKFRKWPFVIVKYSVSSKENN